MAEVLAAAPFGGALTAGRTTTWPFFAPGTAPRTSSSWRASSMRTMSRFWVVRVDVAELARHLLAREHAARILRHRDRAGHVVRTAVAVRRALRLEVVALDRAGEALADRRALHVDELADGEDADRHLRARLVLGGDVSATRNSCTISPATTPALARWPASGLETREAFLSPNDDLEGGVAVGRGGLDLGDAVVRHVEDGDGDGVSVVGEDAHHPHLAAQEAQALIDVSGRVRGRGHQCSPAAQARPLFNARHRLAGLTLSLSASFLDPWAGKPDRV